jgi:hypothetical protein
MKHFLLLFFVIRFTAASLTANLKKEPLIQKWIKGSMFYFQSYSIILQFLYIISVL